MGNYCASLSALGRNAKQVVKKKFNYSSANEMIIKLAGLKYSCCTYELNTAILNSNNKEQGSCTN